MSIWECLSPLGNLQSYIEDEIRQNVAIGREVTTHEYDVHFHGNVATGYIIVDPVTGSSNALIDSGEDGSLISLIGGQLSIILSGVLGYSDSALSCQLSDCNKLWFIKDLNRAKFMANVSKWLGGLAYMLSVFDISSNQSLSAVDKVGQILVTLLTSWLALQLTGALAISATF